MNGSGLGKPFRDQRQRDLRGWWYQLSTGFTLAFRHLLGVQRADAGSERDAPGQLVRNGVVLIRNRRRHLDALCDVPERPRERPPYVRLLKGTPLVWPYFSPC